MGTSREAKASSAWISFRCISIYKTIVTISKASDMKRRCLSSVKASDMVECESERLSDLCCWKTQIPECTV